jgi:hypothetical protein
MGECRRSANKQETLNLLETLASTTDLAPLGLPLSARGELIKLENLCYTPLYARNPLV